MSDPLTEIRTLIVDDGVVSGRVFADGAPDGCTLPYVVITDGIDLNPVLKGDRRTIRLERTMQVSVFQSGDAEDVTVPARVFNLLDGARPANLIVTCQGMQRIFEDSTNIVHRPITLSVKHDTTAV